MKKIIFISLLCLSAFLAKAQTLKINRWLTDSMISAGVQVLYHDTSHNGNWKVVGSGGGGSGSGTVNSGTQYRLAYYAATGTAVSQAGAITASRALVSDANGVPTHSTVTTTELGYVSGVTSAIQTQLNGKQASGSYITSVSGTTDRITSTGGTTPVIDIAATYAGQTSITTLGTIATGVWNGTNIAQNKIAGLSDSLASKNFNLGWFNVIDYDADPTGASDSWQAFTDALNACNAAGGGIVYVPNGLYLTSRVIKFPLNSYDSTRTARTITLLGESEPNFYSNPLTGTGRPTEMGPIIEATFLGDSAVIATEYETVSWGDFNFLGCYIEKLTLRQRSKTAGVDVAPQGTGIDGRKMAYMRVKKVRVDTETDQTVLVSPGTSSRGIRFPATNNFTVSTAEECLVTGYYIAYDMYEHANLDNVTFDACYYGFYFNTANHGMHINRGGAWRSVINVYAGPSASFSIDQLAIEDKVTGSEWWVNSYDLYADSTATGSIKFHRVVTDVGPDNTEFTRNAIPYNITCLPLNETTPSWSTATRPTRISPVGTFIGYNEDSTTLEFYNRSSGEWVVIGTAAAPPAPAGLQGAWNFEEASPGDFLDAVNNYDFARVNSTTTGPAKINDGALMSSASSQYVTNATLTTLPAEFTFVGWFKMAANADPYQVLINKGKTGAGTFQFNVYFNNSDDQLKYQTSSNGSAVTTVVGHSFTPDASWHFIAIRFGNGGYMSIQVDGNAPQYSGSGGLTIHSATPVLNLGADQDAGAPLDGGVDQWRYYNEYLSDADVTYLYNSGAGRDYP